MSTRPKRGWWYGREADATKYQAPIGGRGNKISTQEMVARMRALADAKAREAADECRRAANTTD